MSNSGSPPHTCGWRMCLTYCPKSPSINLPTIATWIFSVVYYDLISMQEYKKFGRATAQRD